MLQDQRERAYTLQMKPGLSTHRCLPDRPTHVTDKREQGVTGDRERREKGHVYNAVHQSTSIPLLFPMLWTSSSLRQKRDILWILVLLAHCTHIVSVAEDEVLFFLKRGLRVLGGASRGWSFFLGLLFMDAQSNESFSSSSENTEPFVSQFASGGFSYLLSTPV